VRTKSAQQSEKILAVAARLFASHRFHETRMEDIAAAAEVGKGTLYRYFQDKDELYTALLVRAGEQLESRLQHALASAATAREKLEAIVSALIEYFDEQPHVLDIIQHAEAMQRADRVFVWKKTRENNLRLVVGVLAEAQERSEFTVEDGELATLNLLGGLRAILRFGERPRPPGLARRIVEHFLHGYAKPSPKPNGRKNGPPVAR
jgi:AcrR family transcriptional regulator